MAESDRPHVLREIAYVCRPAGTLSVPGVYGGLIDKFPMGMIMNKGLTIRTAQTHVNRWTGDLLRRIEEGQLDPSFVITHEVPLERGPEMYRTFRDKLDGCVKVVLSPGADAMRSPIPAGTAGPTRPPDALARGLGWFSIALGVAEITAPHRLARTLGMDGHERGRRLRRAGGGERDRHPGLRRPDALDLGPGRRRRARHRDRGGRDLRRQPEEGERRRCAGLAARDHGGRSLLRPRPGRGRRAAPAPSGTTATAPATRGRSRRCAARARREFEIPRRLPRPPPRSAPTGRHRPAVDGGRPRPDESHDTRRHGHERWYP